MKDRVSNHPGQYTLTDSDGTKTVTLVRDDDPVVPGTPLNKATLLSDDAMSALGLTNPDATPSDALIVLSKMALLASVTYYVNSSTGSASNDGLTPSTPLDNINRALGKIPKNLNGKTATIVLSNNYSNATEQVSISNFYGGAITLQLGTGSARIGSISVTRCAYVEIANQTGSTAPLTMGMSGATNIITVTDAVVRFSNAETRVTTFDTYGVRVVNGGVLTVTGAIGVRPSTSASAAVSGTYGVVAETCGRIYISSTACASYPNIRYCQFGFRALTGGVIAYNTTNVTLSSNTTDLTGVYGGRIYADTQTSLPNY